MALRVDYPAFKARLVMGDLFNIGTKTHDGKPELDETKHNWFVGFAVPKSEWAPIDAAMKNAAYNEPTCGKALADQPGFNFKVEDCDAPADPKKLGSDQYPAGHMLIKFSRYRSMGAIPVFDGSHQPILNQASIKRGDYFWISASTTFNGAQTVKTNAGMYQNLNGVMFAEEGQAIEGGAFNPLAAFAGVAGGTVQNGGTVQTGAVTPSSYVPPQQQAASTPPPPAQTTVQPAHDMVQPGNAAPPPPPPAAPSEPSYDVGGKVYTKSALLAGGYTEAHFANMTPIA